jgi:hypothetical protein
MLLRFLMLALAFSLTAHAQTKFGEQAPPPGAPGATPQALKPLEERKDVVSWKLFAQVELVRVKDRFVPQFSSGVAALDKKEVKVQGFMMPLEMGDKQTHFILAALPQTCAFCLPGGPEQMVEIRSKVPVKYTFEPIVVSGRLAVLKDDPTGVFYRLTEAVPAK